MVSMVIFPLIIVWKSNVDECGHVQITPEIYLWFLNLVNLVKGLTDRYLGFTAEKAYTDLPNLCLY